MQSCVLLCAVSPSISRRRGRRGSFQQITPSKCYRDTLKGSAVHRFDCEGQARIIQVRV